MHCDMRVDLRDGADGNRIRLRRVSAYPQTSKLRLSEINYASRTSRQRGRDSNFNRHVLEIQGHARKLRQEIKRQYSVNAGPEVLFHIAQIRGHRFPFTELFAANPQG
jgi:hypothetical protein